MKIGIYGGSFNPVHFGHTGLAEWIVQNTDLDAVWMLVTPNNPLKPASMLADEQVRLQGVREAVADIPGVEASDFEFHLPRPSYTANTLRELKRTYPEHQFTLIIGEDNWDIHSRWREWDWIEQNVRIFVYPRHHQSSITNHQSSISPCPYLLEGAPYFDISSTEIRQARGPMPV